MRIIPDLTAPLLNLRIILIRNRIPLLFISAAILLSAASVITGFAVTGIMTAVEKPPETAPAALPQLVVYPARWHGGSRAACSITFDDGTMDQYLLGAEELEKRDIRGTFFVITDLMDNGVWKDGETRRKLFSWDQARDLEMRGHEIASHTAEHLDLQANPGKAEKQIEKAYTTLSRELYPGKHFTLSWPYWRVSREALEYAAFYHFAARAGRAGGAGSTAGAEYFYEENSKTPRDYMQISSRGIMPSGTPASLLPVIENAYQKGGWFIPNFHGIKDSRIPLYYTGWEALELEAFTEILDILSGYDFWFAPFGDAAKYARQRDALQLDVSSNPKNPESLTVRYSGGLDPEVYNSPITLVLVPSHGFSITAVKNIRCKMLLKMYEKESASFSGYYVEIPPGDGELLVVFEMSGR